MEEGGGEGGERKEGRERGEGGREGEELGRGKKDTQYVSKLIQAK